MHRWLFAGPAVLSRHLRMSISMISKTRETVIRWLAIVGGALLLAYAAYTPLVMLFFALPTPPNDVVIMGAMAVLLVGSVAWLRKQDRAKTIVEYSTLAAAALFVVSVICIIGTTLYEFTSNQQASDPGGPALAVTLVIMFSAVYVVQAVVCLAVGLVLRRGRRSGKQTAVNG